MEFGRRHHFTKFCTHLLGKFVLLLVDQMLDQEFLLVNLIALRIPELIDGLFDLLFVKMWVVNISVFEGFLYRILHIWVNRWTLRA